MASSDTHTTSHRVGHDDHSAPTERRQHHAARSNPDGNERLTATVGVALAALTVAELATLVLGLQQFLSLHVLLGLVLIPPLLLKLGSTGWRFARYYTRNRAYLVKGPPILPMRLLAPLLVVATTAVFGSGVAMGFLHGSSLQAARRVHGPASVVWMVLLGVHVLVHAQRALRGAAADLGPRSRRGVRGARWRSLLLVGAVFAGLALAAAALPIDHRWLHLGGGHRDHDDDHRASLVVTGGRR